MADRFFHHRKTVPLSVYLLVPLVLPMLLAVGLTGWLSLRSHQKATQEWVFQWMSEVSDRFEHQLTLDLIFFQNLLDSYQPLLLENSAKIQPQDDFLPFFERLPSLQGIYLGSHQKRVFFSAFRHSQDQGIFQVADATTDHYLHSYSLQTQAPFNSSEFTYDLHQQSWYQDTINTHQIKVKAMAAYSGDQPSLSVGILQPIYDQNNNPIGAGKIDFNLDYLGNIFNQFNPQLSADVLILDLQGKPLWSSPTSGESHKIFYGQILPKIQDNLQKGENQINPDRLQDQDGYWILMTPYRFAEQNIVWFVIAVPENQVLKPSFLYFRNYLLLNLIGLGVAIALGSIVLHHLTQAIHQIRYNIQRSIQTDGKTTWDQKFLINELNQLIYSCKNLSKHWGKLLESLQDENHQLLEQVKAESNLLVEVVEKSDIANLKLQESQSLLASIINSSMDGIMALKSVRDHRDKIIDFQWIVNNEIICNFFDIELKDLVGKLWLKEVKSPNLRGLFEAYIRVVEQGESLELEFPYDRAEERYWFHMIAVKLGDGLSVNFRNITGQKKSAFELRKMLDEVHKLANTDSLTKVANRRQFDEYLYQEWLRLKRDRLPLSLILCDVDYFKLYNDTYGHQAGDHCLIQVAAAIQNCVRRSTDLVARYGGEEFVILLPNTSPEGAKVVAQLIQSKVQDLQIPHKTSRAHESITLSLGVATLIPAPELSKENLIALADEALYQAKQQGRNQVVVKS